MHKKLSILFISVFILLASSAEVSAQSNPDARGAFLRSLVMPGWGHYYADKEDWTRGKYHLGADAVLIGTIFGFNARTNNLQQQYFTLSNLRAGVDISGRSRSFQLAIGDFNSLAEYNDFQLRTRNWHRIIDDIPENRWEWDELENRRRYRELRSSRDRIRNQFPVLGAFMVVNRVISGISAYSRARTGTGTPELSLFPVDGTTGVAAQIRLQF